MALTTLIQSPLPHGSLPHHVGCDGYRQALNDLSQEASVEGRSNHTGSIAPPRLLLLVLVCCMQAGRSHKTKSALSSSLDLPKNAFVFAGRGVRQSVDQLQNLVKA